jgi:hypothetical protein
MLGGLFRVIVNGLYYLGVWQLPILCERLCGRRHHIVVVLYHTVTSAEHDDFAASVPVDAISLATLNQVMTA